MAGKVSLQGFVATHRDSGTMGVGWHRGRESNKATRGHFHHPRTQTVAGFEAVLPVDSSMKFIMLSRTREAVNCRGPHP